MNEIFVNPFEDKNKVYREAEIMKLLNSPVTIKKFAADKGNNTIKANFADFIRLASSPDYKEWADTVKSMKGWKHNKDKAPNNKTKGENFDDVKTYLTPQCILTSYVESGEDVRGLREVKNPYLIIDIDNIPVTEENLHKIQSFNFVMITGVSISGEGYYSVVRLPDTVKSVEDLKECFKWISKDFEDEAGIILDSQCTNINRFRNLSPYTIYVNENFTEPYDFIPQAKAQDSKFKPASFQVNRLSVSSFIEVPDSLKVYGCKGVKDYYRKAKGFDLEFPTYDDKGIEIEGRNYNILYSYANAIYRVLGEDGWDLYRDYFPETPEQILKNCGWSSAKYWKGEVKRRIVKEVERLVEEAEDDED